MLYLNVRLRSPEAIARRNAKAVDRFLRGGVQQVLDDPAVVSGIRSGNERQWMPAVHAAVTRLDLSDDVAATLETQLGAAIRTALEAHRSGTFVNQRKGPIRAALSLGMRAVRLRTVWIGKRIARRMSWLPRFWARTLGPLPYKFWIVYISAFTFVIPSTVLGLILLPGMWGAMKAQAAIMEAADAGRFSRRREAIAIGLLVALASGAYPLLDEWADPGPLPRVAVTVPGRPPVTGVFVANTGTGVYVGRNGELITVPQRLVEQVIVKSAPAQKPEKLETLWQRLQ